MYAFSSTVPQEGASIAETLTRADAELSVAIDSFQRARRVSIRDFFFSRDTAATEEVHVGHGVNALLNAERHVAVAVRAVEDLPSGDPARGQLWPRVRILDTTVRTVMTELGQRPDPTRVVTQLKAARRVIPTVV